LVRAGIPGELADHAAEPVRRLGPALLLVGAARDLELRVRGERARRVLLDQLRQRGRTVRRLAQAVERAFLPARRLARRGGAGIGRDRLREARERVGILARVVGALRQSQRRDRRRAAAGEVRQQALVAALRVVVAAGLEVGVAGTRPRA